MNCIDRRGLLTLMLGAAAAATIGSGLDLQVAEAAPPPLGGSHSDDGDDMLHRAQVVVVGPRRPRRRWRGRGFGPGRRWRCWWQRGRRVCGWRW
jgi:hypothetical protein